MVENLHTPRHRRPRYTFDNFKAVVDALAAEIEKKHPKVQVHLRTHDLMTYSLSVAPRDHIGFATILFGIEDLDGKIALGGVTVTTPDRLRTLLERFWQVDDFQQTLQEMEDLASTDPEGRVFLEPVHPGAALPFAFTMTLKTFQEMVTKKVGEEVSIIVRLMPRGDPAEATFDFTPDIRYACFAGYWLRIEDRRKDAPGLWQLQVTRTIDPRVQRRE